MHLTPNNQLIHPAARITHYAPDGSVTKTVPLLRSSVLVYEGVVIDEAWTAHRLREDAAGGVSRPWDEPPPGELGWARIMVHEQGNPDAGLAPVYEGAFSVLGEVYHILTRENYVRSRGHRDAHPDDLIGVDLLDNGLVIFRDSDMEKPPITEAHMCSHDALEFNNDVTHPVQQAGQHHEPKYTGAAWYDPLGLFDTPEPVPRMGMLGKRDDVAGSNSTSK